MPELKTSQHPAQSHLRSDAAGPQLIAWIAAFGLLVVGAWFYFTAHDWTTLYLRDLRVYQSAIDAFAGGDDPYQATSARHAQGLFFTSPPFVWLLYKLAAHSALRPIFGPLLLAANAVSIVAAPVLLSRLLLGPGSGRTALGAAFFFSAFAGAGFFTALVINNGTPLYALIAWGLYLAIRQDRWLWFHLAVALATAFKPFYAAFWIVPLLADTPWGRQWAACALGLAAAALSYIAPMLLAPKLFAAWLHTLVQQTVGEGLLGDNLLGAMLHDPNARHSHLAAYEAQGLLSAILLAAVLMLGRLTRAQRLAGLLLAAVFLNPRASRYDLSFAAIPLLALAADALVQDRSSATVQAAWAIGLAVVMAAFSHNTPADGFLYAGVAVAALYGAMGASYVKPAPAG